MDKDKLTDEINQLIDQYFSLKKPDFEPGKTKLSLISPTFSAEEVKEAVESLLSTWVTMGKKVKQFENIFASYVNTKYASMVNSGSSANLLALSILTNPSLKKPILPGTEIITPAVTWATTVYPIINVGCVPVLVDVDLETYNLNTDEVQATVTEKTSAIMPVHLTGNPCDMEKVMEIAKSNDLYVLEDACEAHGAEINGKRVGSFGDLATFSFFISHHITTMEGGMITTNNDEFDDLAKSMRVFGWIRDMKKRDELAQQNSEIDPRFLFTNIGYNLRPTDLQGAFGIHQMKKLEKFIEIRRDNAKYWNKKLSEYEDYILVPEERQGTRHVYFCYPLLVKENSPFPKTDLTDFLESKMIETRPIMAGNIAEQPGMKLFNHRVAGYLKNSRLIHRNGFFFGNHQDIGNEERSFIADCLKEFLDKNLK